MGYDYRLIAYRYEGPEDLPAVDINLSLLGMITSWSACLAIPILGSSLVATPLVELVVRLANPFSNPHDWQFGWPTHSAIYYIQ